MTNKYLHETLTKIAKTIHLASLEVNFILCLTVDIYPSPPANQPDCKMEQCQCCNADIWVSATKRTLRENYKKEEIYTLCWICCAKINAIRTVHDKERHDIVNIDDRYKKSN